MNDSSSEHTESTSITLLKGVRAHDPEAWSRLSRLYAPEVYRWVRQVGLQDSDASDIAQNVFLAVANNIDKFRRDRANDSFRGWLWTITRNKIRDFHRQRGERPPAQGGTVAHQHMQRIAADIPPDDETVDSRTATAIRLSRRALEIIKAEFEEQTWKIFCWITIDGRSATEIAEELGMSKAAVRQAKYRVAKRLRQELDGLIDQL